MSSDPDGVEELFNQRIAGVKNAKVRRWLANAFAPPSSGAANPAAGDLSRLLLK